MFGDQSKLDLEAGFDKFNLAPFGSLLGSVLSDVRGMQRVELL